MQCLQCKKEFQPPRYANNIKFCGNKCRELSYNDYRTEWSRKNRAKKQDGKLECLICGGWFFKICSHAWITHGIDNREYKKMFGIDLGKGLVNEEYKKHKRELAYNQKGNIQNNLLKAGQKTRFVKGDPRAGNYERSPETLQRLKTQFKKKKI